MLFKNNIFFLFLKINFSRKLKRSLRKKPVGLNGHLERSQ
jgi:hypothetical protein